MATLDTHTIIKQLISSGVKEKRSEEHTSELQSHHEIVCRLLLEKKNKSKENVSGHGSR